MSKTATCLDCGISINHSAKRCRPCANIARTKQKEQHIIPVYNDNRPAEVIHIEDIAHNSVVITAFQGESMTQMEYHKDTVLRAIDRLQQNRIASYTFDPLVYNSKQNTNKITIAKDTIIGDRI